MVVFLLRGKLNTGDFVHIGKYGIVGRLFLLWRKSNLGPFSIREKLCTVGGPVKTEDWCTYLDCTCKLTCNILVYYKNCNNNGRFFFRSVCLFLMCICKTIVLNIIIMISFKSFVHHL